MIITSHILLADICKTLKKGGHTIVLASGGFDILHVGHIRYLNASKNEGSVLIVALNSDVSVMAFKQVKTYQPLEERMEIIDAIKGVDIVTCYEEPTGHHLMSLIKPDIHAKGTDYSPETLPEYQYLIEIGVKVVFVGDKKT